MELTFQGGAVMRVLSLSVLFVLQFPALSGLTNDGCEDRPLSWSGRTFHVRRCPYSGQGAGRLAGVSDSRQVTKVPITVRLLGDFMEDLRNDSSTTYINFTDEFNRAMASVFKDLQSFVGVEIQDFRAGSIVVEFDIIIQDEIEDVDDVIDVVSVIASSLNSANSTLGNFTVGEVAFVADDNSTSTVSPCDCGELNCVNVLGDCVAFCSSNINYCLNGGSCRSNRTAALFCDCLATPDVFYTGERCEDEVMITHPPPTTSVDTESPTDPPEDGTVQVTTVVMTTSPQEPKTSSSAHKTLPSTSRIVANNSAAVPTASTTVLRDSTIVPTAVTAVTNVSVQSPTPTPSPKTGPVPPSECTFPFEYNNKVYYECTTADSSQPWCAWDSVFRYSRWGYCEVQEPREPECRFPFVYQGNYYFSCTTENSYKRPWCGFDTLYQQNKWRYCDGTEEDLKPEPPEDTQCSFPFLYKGNIYYSCTTEDYILPWCARDRLYHPGRWVLCEGQTADTGSELSADTTQPDEKCQPQFWYKDELFTGCTAQDSMYPWCAWDVVYRKGRWSVCDGDTEKDTGDGSGFFSGSGSGDGGEEGSAIPPSQEDSWLCHIPFVYKDKTYHGCTTKDSLIPWCSVDPVYQPGQDRWIFCGEELPDSDRPSQPANEPDGQCVFPFYYNNVLYTACSMAGSLTPWCAWDRVYRDNRWSYCGDALPPPSGVEGRPYDCVFPFHYGGHWNYDCIVSESGRPWCPWDQFYRTGRYSFCDVDKKNERPPPDEGSGEPDMSGSGQETACSFPFHYNGASYKHCTLVDSLLPWCAWDETFQEGRWSVCDFTQDQENYSGDDISGSGSGDDLPMSGSGAEIPCTFPFRYEGIWYDDCSNTDSILPWCAWDSKFQVGRWSVCDWKDGRTDDDNDKGSGEGEAGRGGDEAWLWDDTSCVFPFTYKGVLYHKCSVQDSLHPWCSVDAGYEHGSGRWAYCTAISDVTDSTKPTQMPESHLRDPRCTFPFYYKQQWHTECTMEGSSIPWCAWDYVLLYGRWSYCGTNAQTRPTEGSGNIESSGDQTSGSGDVENSCVFPFWYNDVWYSDCTLIDSIVPWCAWDQYYEEGRYTTCKEAGKPSHAQPAEGSGDTQASGSGDDEECSFPFMYNGVLYTDCTTVDSIVPWCAWDPHYREGRYSTCEDIPEDHMPVAEDGKTCVFPFEYDGKSYDKCTTKDSLIPWCAWDEVYQFRRWSFCKDFTKPTHPPPAVPDDCVFPFYYRGEWYNECTEVGYILPWCAWDQTYAEGRWSTCEGKPDNEHARPSDENCVFPFVYKGFLFTQCTSVDSARPWCSWGYLHTAGRWSYCDCTFPFQYQGKTYHECTTDDWHEPWCALDSQYRPHRWMACTERITSTLKPVETTTSRPSDPATTEVLTKTEFVTRQPTTDVEIVTDFFTPVATREPTTEDLGEEDVEGTTVGITPTEMTTATTQLEMTSSYLSTEEPTMLSLTTQDLLETTTDDFALTETTKVELEAEQETTVEMAQSTMTEFVPEVTTLSQTEQALTSSPVPVSTFVEVLGTTPSVMETTPAPTTAQGQISSVPVSTSEELTTFVAMQGTTTPPLPQDTTLVAVEGTTSSAVAQDTTSISVKGITTSVAQDTTSVAQDTMSVATDTTSAVAQDTTSVASDTTSVAQATTSIAQATTSVASDTTSVASDTTSVAQATTSVAQATATVAQATTSVPQDTNTVAQATTSVAQATTSVASDTTSVAQATTSVAQATTTVAQDTTSAVAQDTTSVAQNTTSVAQATTTVAQDTTSVAQTTTSVASDTTSVAQATTSVAQATTSVASDTTSVAQDTTSVAQDTTTVAQDTTTVAQDTTSAVAHATTSVAQSTTSVAQATTSVAQDTTSAVAQATTSAVAQDTTSAVAQDTTSVAARGTTTVAVAQGTTSVAVQGTTTSALAQDTTSLAVQGTTSISTQKITTVSVQGASTASTSTATTTVTQATTSGQVTTTSGAAQGTTSTTFKSPSTAEPTTEKSTSQILTTPTLPVTTVVTSAVAIEVQITSQNFTEELTNSSSAKYQQLAQDLIDSLSQLYADVPGFQGIVINGFREGSVIAEFDVIIGSTSQAAVSPLAIGSVLQTAMDNSDSTLGNFVVGRLSVAVEGNFTEMSTCSNSDGCGNGVKCTKMGNKCMAFCQANAGYCYNGGQCSDAANNHLTCLCSWNLWRYYSGDRCQRVETSVILYIIIGSCAGGLLIILSAVCWIGYIVKRNRNKGNGYSVDSIQDPGQEGSVRRYGYSKDPFMRSLAEMLEQSAVDTQQPWKKQIGYTNQGFLYQPEEQRMEPEDDMRTEENQQNLMAKLRIYDAQVHDGMRTMSSAAGSQDITIHFPPRSPLPRDDVRVAHLHTTGPRLMKGTYLRPTYTVPGTQYD